MQLQVVRDNDMKFTDVYCGWPGAVHDARVLRSSPLSHDERGGQMISFVDKHTSLEMQLIP